MTSTAEFSWAVWSCKPQICCQFTLPQITAEYDRGFGNYNRKRANQLYLTYCTCKHMNVLTALLFVGRPRKPFFWRSYRVSKWDRHLQQIKFIPVHSLTNYQYPRTALHNMFPDVSILRKMPWQCDAGMTISNIYYRNRDVLFFSSPRLLSIDLRATAKKKIKLVCRCRSCQSS